MKWVTKPVCQRKTPPTNASLSISMNRSVTDLAIVSGFGVDTSSSLSAFFVGSLAAGASATVVRQYNASPGVTSINSGIGLVSTAVPEPASLVTMALGMAAAVVWHRKRSANRSVSTVVGLRP